jgi:ABC-2 type transport system ATP-binding protein
MRSAIEATGLGKRYRSMWALRDCCVNIPAGRITGLIGPNGAGKTTLLKLAIGLLTPDAGEIQVLGWSPITQPALVLARVGYVAQDRPLYPRFTASDMLRMGHEMNPKWDDGAARDRLIKRDIPLDQQIRKLSGGQQAQVSLALALGKRPDLLLLDEPASNLDPLARREFLRELVDAVATEGISVVLSSHSIADVERVCDYLVILARGRVQVAGDIDSLLAGHRVLVGPRVDADAVALDPTVVKAAHTERETALLVRTDGKVPPAQWRAEQPALEDLVLAYLENPAAGTMPKPEVLHEAAR